MKRILKKITGIILVAAITITLVSCADTSIAMNVDGNSILAGEYIYSQFSALGAAVTKFEEEYPDVDTSVEGFDYFSYTIEGITFRDWVINESANICTRRTAYSKLFDELGLEFTAEEISEQRKSINDAWTVEDAYMSYYYGITDYTVWGAYYESLGISKTSFQKAYEGEEKAKKVFNAYYGTGGEFEVSDQTLWDEMVANYARYQMLEIKLTDVDDLEITDTTELAALEEMGEDYVARLKAGELFSEISASYDDFILERDMEAYPENYTDDEENEETQEDSDTDSETEADETDSEENEENEENEETGENDNDKIISKTSTTPSEEIVKHIFEMEISEPELYKTEDVYYVIVRLDITEREDWFESYRETLLYSLKGEEMLGKVDEVANSLTVEKNQAALDRYEPIKLM